MRKSYLSQQIRLMSISTYDLMTDDEWAKYQEIIDVINKLNAAKDKETKVLLAVQRKERTQELGELIAKHKGQPRYIRLPNVLNTARFKDGKCPLGVSWWDLRQSKQISEFVSDGSRTMGLDDRSITFDKIIVKWKSADILEQIVLDGFYMPVMQNDSVVMKHYQITTASAGQLRTDKVQALSDEGLQAVECLNCGITDEIINEKGGINQNKFMAYSALPFSATDPWPEFNIDESIVIDDFEANVTGRMLYITNEYEHIKGINTVPIKHTDGCGMKLPDAYGFTNAMVRGPYIKGLLTSFDFLKFCRVHGVAPIIKDVWGQEHNLVLENIKVIFCKSQLKLWNYYDSWEHYKTEFKRNNCHMNLTNYEETYAKDVPLNYQFLQPLIDMTDEEIDRLVKPTESYITSIAQNKHTMLRILGADENSERYYQKALGMYPELLHEAYSHESLRSIKRRMVLDARSGKLMCRNKRLYVIPDMYAACEYWFLGIQEPQGIVKPDEVVCKAFIRSEYVDVLRSPSLYFEHNIRKVCKDPNVYEWFQTNAIVTGCRDLISRVLQFDEH